jgi:hypothetical protein
MTAGAVCGQRDLRGGSAREVTRTIPRNDNGQWPPYRVDEDHAVPAARRYLLPHE